MVTSPPRHSTAGSPARGHPATPWLIAIPAGFAALLWACRAALLGTAVADDYSFLARLRFHAPLDWLDSMGASYYWRPVSRQLYFTLVGPWLLRAPWGDALIHAGLLAILAVLLYRIARHDVSPTVAAMVATAVVLSEPARALLGWPSGAQHLLAGTAAVLAVHEAMAGRLVSSGVAALAAVLSHESAAIVLPVLPLAAWRRSGDRGDSLRAVQVAIVVGALWTTGYRMALAHGVVLPPSHRPDGATTTSPLTRLPELYTRALAAATNLEDVHGEQRSLIVAGATLVLIAAMLWLRSPDARRRLRTALPTVATAAAWFAIGVLPLALLLPDWNAWRAWTPTLGITVALTLALGAISPWLSGAWIGLRLAALLLAPIGVVAVSKQPPPAASHESFTRLARLQRTVDAAHRALMTSLPRLPHGGRVCYSEMPRLAEVAFQGSHALQVWYGDSTLVWDLFGGQRGFTEHIDAGIEFRYDGSVTAAVIPGASIARFQEASALVLANRYRAADSALVESIRLLGDTRGPYYASLVLNQGLNAYNRGAMHDADSLARLAAQAGPESADLWLLRAALAWHRGDREGAVASIRRALAINPEHADAIAFARTLGLAP